MKSFVLESARLWVGDGRALDGHLIVEGETVAAVGPGQYAGPLPVVRLEGLALSPGLVDLMVLGGFQKSILTDDPADIAREYLRLGVTALQFCIGSLPMESIRRIAENLRTARRQGPAAAARIAGWYLEGPFQQPDLAGASLAQHTISPTPANVENLLRDVGDVLTMINVSPGLEHDAEAVRQFRAAGKVVTMAHSNAAAARATACVAAGTTVLGHIWDNNAGRIGDSGVQQPTIDHVALTDERVKWIHLICDGVHVHPVMIQIILRCRGIGAVCLVTDGNRRSGCPDGPFVYDDGRNFVKEKGVCRTDAGWLAGSATLLPDMFRHFVRFTARPAAEAIQTVTLNPARCLGLDARLGSLEPGKLADLVAWDDHLRVRRVWRGGREIGNVSDFAEVTMDSPQPL